MHHSLRMLTLAVLVVTLLVLVPGFGLAGKGRQGNGKDPVSASVEGRQRYENMARPGGDYVPGELLIKFVEGGPRRGIVNAAQRLGARHLKTFSHIGVQHWRLGRGVSVEQALEILSRPPFQAYVEYAEPNYIFHADDFYPNDARRGELWSFHNIGQTGGLKDADIDAPAAWALLGDSGAPSAGIVVGVIDTGVDYTHEDLAGRFWENPGETGQTAKEGVDDDGNGYIDDINGWDFVNDDNDPMDDHGHGTHVAGTIGAVGNNGIGVAGVNWNVKFVPLKFLNAGGSGTTDDAVEAVLYAAALGLRITNNSWGGGRRSKALQNAIASSDALFVAAAGNSGSSRNHFPAAYPLDNIISVAATDVSDQLASFSNYSSTWVDLGAPGVEILSTLPGDDYGFGSGTSMAAPHVTGVAALVMAQFSYLSNAEVKARLLDTAEPKSSLQGTTVSGGRLNALFALEGTETPDTDVTPPEAVTSLLPTEPTPDSVTLSWRAPADDDVGLGGPVYLYDVRYAVGYPEQFNWETATRAAGAPVPAAPGTLETFTVTGLTPDTSYSFALKSMDASGNPSALSPVVFASTLQGTWLTETVDSEGSVGYYNSLTYGLDAYPVIAYSDRTNQLVKLAQWNGGAWEIQIVDSGNMAIDVAVHPTSGHPCVSYASDKLTVACWDGASWDIQAVEKKGRVPDVTSLAFHPDGTSYLSYPGWGKGRTDLRLARWNGAAWEIETVDAGVWPRYSSLAFDAAGNPAIAYSADIDNDGWLETLKFAHWNGSAWDIEILETGVVGYGVFADLAFDPVTGNPSVVHHASGVVHFLRRVCEPDCQWQVLEVDDGTGTSLAYDPSGAPVISYHDYSQLKFARWNGASWDTEKVDGVSNIWRTSVAFDLTAGAPSISYTGGSFDLKFAQRRTP